MTSTNKNRAEKAVAPEKSVTSFSRRQFVRAGAAALGAAAVGTLAGCASSGAAGTSAGSGAASSASSAAGAASSSSATRKLTFVLDYTPNTNHTGVYVALSKGYYASAGLEVEVVQPPEDGADALVGAGKAELGVGYQDVMANYLGSDKPLPVHAIAAVIQHNTSGIMSRAEDGITRPRAMEGHIYATWGQDVEQAMVKSVVTTDGGDFSKVTLVPYATDDEVAGLKSHQFDDVWVYEGWALQNAKVKGLATNYFSFRDIDSAFDFYTPVLIANDDFLQSSPDVARAFVAATRKGYEYAIANPDDAASILCAAVPELDPELVKLSQEYLAGQYTSDASGWGVIDATRWNRFYRWMNEKGLVAKTISDNTGFTLDYLA